MSSRHPGKQVFAGCFFRQQLHLSQFAEQPREEALLSGELEPIMNGMQSPKYLVLSSLKLSTPTVDAISPAHKFYGPGDNYHPTGSHVLPALIRRFHEAKERCESSVTC